MKMQSVDSSTIKARGFDPETGTLHVHFEGGGKYTYPFTQEKFDEWCRAESAGKWFHSNVKGSPAHPHTKVE